MRKTHCIAGITAKAYPLYRKPYCIAGTAAEDTYYIAGTAAEDTYYIAGTAAEDTYYIAGTAAEDTKDMLPISLKRSSYLYVHSSLCHAHAITYMHGESGLDYDYATAWTVFQMQLSKYKYMHRY